MEDPVFALCGSLVDLLSQAAVLIGLNSLI